jgi:anaerobic selenocysteine-containing dehydrogenase
VLARARTGDIVGPGVVALPSGWWASRSPGGASDNALTTEELTDRGGGASVHGARVEVEAVIETDMVTEDGVMGRERSNHPVEVS